jgi:hypothetical protein
VGQLLAAAAGKELLVRDGAEDWLATAQSLVCDSRTASLTFVVPMWNPATLAADPSWLKQILILMRGMRQSAAGLAWGIVTGIDARTLSLHAAKSILQPEIISTYARHPTLLFTNDDESAIWPIPAMEARRRPDPVQLVDLHRMPELARSCAEYSWNAAVFKGHGRSYCAFEGHFCGARDFSDDPRSTPRSCVLGTTCFDPKWPQIDPRRHDAPVVVLDSCVIGSWGSPGWLEGSPSLAFYAAAGSASAVITSEGATLNASGDYVDLFWALGTSLTMGEATARLNQMRSDCNLPFTYYLLGDPDIPAGPSRWPEWATRTLATSRQPAGDRRRWSVTIPQTSAPFVQVPLPVGEEDGTRKKTVYAWPSRNGAEVRGCRLVGSQEARELWVTTEGIRGREVEIEQAAWPGVLAGLAGAAAGVPSRVATWNAPLDKTAPRLIQAARQVVQLDRVVEQFVNGAAAGSPKELRTLVEIAVAEWSEAQVECVRAALELAPRGLWPTRLWQAGRMRSQPYEIACPHCGLAPTLHRRYFSAPELERAQWECIRCDLIFDEPAGADYPELTFRAPEFLPRHGSASAEITVRHRGKAADMIGAGAIVVDGTMDHPVCSDPAYFPIRLQPGGSFNTRVTLSLEGTELIPHFYRVRAILLLNGHWFLASRLTVGPRG